MPDRFQALAVEEAFVARFAALRSELAMMERETALASTQVRPTPTSALRSAGEVAELAIELVIAQKQRGFGLKLRGCTGRETIVAVLGPSYSGSFIPWSRKWRRPSGVRPHPQLRNSPAKEERRVVPISRSPDVHAFVRMRSVIRVGA